MLVSTDITGLFTSVLGWRQHPSEPSLPTLRNSHGLSSPLEHDHLLANILHFLDYFSLYKNQRVCKKWKKIIKGEDFDAVMFRLREGKPIPLREIKEIRTFNLHPIFQDFSFTPGDTTRYRPPKYAPDIRRIPKVCLNQTVIWPPVVEVQVGHHTSGSAWEPLVTVKNLAGVTLEQAIDAWEETMEHRNHFFVPLGPPPHSSQRVFKACNGWKCTLSANKKWLRLCLHDWHEITECWK